MPPSRTQEISAIQRAGKARSLREHGILSSPKERQIKFIRCSVIHNAKISHPPFFTRSGRVAMPICQSRCASSRGSTAPTLSRGPICVDLLMATKPRKKTIRLPAGQMERSASFQWEKEVNLCITCQKQGWMPSSLKNFLFMSAIPLVLITNCWPWVQVCPWEMKYLGGSTSWKKSIIHFIYGNNWWLPNQAS